MLTHKPNAHTSEGRNTHRSTQIHTNSLALSSRHIHWHMIPCVITWCYQNTFERHVTMTCAWHWAWAKIKTYLGSWEECLDGQRHSSDEIISRDILSVTGMKACLSSTSYISNQLHIICNQLQMNLWVYDFWMAARSYDLLITIPPSET